MRLSTSIKVELPHGKVVIRRGRRHIIRRARNERISKDLLALEHTRVEVGRRVQLEQTLEESLASIRPQLCEISCDFCGCIERLVREREAFVAFVVHEHGDLGEVAGEEFAGGEVADDVAVDEGAVPAL